MGNIINKILMGNTINKTPMHDLVIRIITKYIQGDNKTLLNLQCVSKRFLGLRHMFISQVILSNNKSGYAYLHKPYGWNKVHTLKLRMYYSKTRVDISELGLIHTLSLGDYEISDITVLSKVRNLSLHLCIGINDNNISALSKVRTLSLYWIPEIRDVSPLAYVHKLTLFSCKNITDVSALSSVYDLTIYYCNNIYDVSALKDVPILTINSCNNLESVQRSKKKI